jgi:mono/diheme cytochrome c family protein
MSLGACSLAGDITPPPGLATAQAQGLGLPPTAAPLTVPGRTPDLVAGALIFAEKCAACHGESGDGQGPQASALPNPPTALRDADVAQRALPAEWFAIVTEGRIESFMPGFTSLDDEQRWDVVGYALSLGLPSAQVDLGSNLFRDNCVECHAAQGPDMSSADYLAGRSLLAIYGAITEGVGEGMPGYAASLTDEQRWALAVYVRSLALSASAAQLTAAPPPDATATTGEPAPTLAEGEATAALVATGTATEEQASAAGRISGNVANGTAGSRPPTELEVTLHGLDNNQEALTQTQRLGPAGTFTFDGIEPVVGRVYVVTADYQGVLYASEIGGMSSAELELPLTVFESAAATDAVEVSRLHLLFDFPAEDVVQVVELWLLSNLGDRTVDGGEAGVIDVVLPQGASGLSLDGGTIGDRFELTADGFRDRRELLPGENTGELVFSYNLPYDGSLDLVRRPGYPVAATVAMVSGDGPELVGADFTDMGLRQISGASLHSYERGPAQAGEEIALTLRGRATAGGAGAAGIQPIVLGVAALALALIGAALIWPSRPWLAARMGFRQRRAAGLGASPTGAFESEADADRLLWAVASLDNDFAAGKIEPAVYQSRRADLLRRVKAVGRD